VTVSLRIKAFAGQERPGDTGTGVCPSGPAACARICRSVVHQEN